MQREQGLFLSMTDCYCIFNGVAIFFSFGLKKGDLEEFLTFALDLDRDEVR